MNKTKDKKIEKWIDLSKLPKIRDGRVDWRNSIGMKVPFRYGNTTGEVELLKYAGNNKYDVLIYVNERVISYRLSSTLIKNCNFGYAIKQPVGVTHPELIKYFVNRKDAFKYPTYHTKLIGMKCPICGFKKQQTVESLVFGGFSCPKCSDGKSWAEKFMFNMLDQLKVKFKNEITKKDSGFEWVGRYRYDFYVEHERKGFLIEMDGHFHDGSNFHEYEDVHIVDLEKDRLAAENGFHIIRIDCRYPDIVSRFEFIKNNILTSNLSTFLNLNCVDWELANKSALSSYVKIASDFYNNGVTSPAKIGELLGINRATVRKYLKMATEIGWCSYVTINGMSTNRIRPIALYKDDDVVGVFINARDLDRRSYDLYGVHMDFRNIHAACKNTNRHRHVGGYTPKYITYDEYKHLLSQFLIAQSKYNNMQEVI